MCLKTTLPAHHYNISFALTWSCWFVWTEWWWRFSSARNYCPSVANAGRGEHHVSLFHVGAGLRFCLYLDKLWSCLTYWKSEQMAYNLQLAFFQNNFNDWKILYFWKISLKYVSRGLVYNLQVSMESGDAPTNTNTNTTNNTTNTFPLPITLSTGWQDDPSQKLLQGDRLPQNEEGLPLS